MLSHKIQQLKISDSFSTTVEITGPDDALECLVFSHGFGVQRDARGLFSFLIDQLSAKYKCIQFDYNTIGEGGNLEVASFFQMEQTLQMVVEKYATGTIHVVGHSMGCLLAARKSNLFNGRFIMLTPLLEPLGTHLRDYLLKRPATKALTNGDLSAMRSDGSITLVKKIYFDELYSLEKDPVEIFSAITNPLDIVIAENDDTVGYHPQVARSIQNATVTSVNSNHDLEGDVRKDILNIIAKK